MYEDFNSTDANKPEESDESGTWPSYPSYTRFTFTGKPKSRLGRNNRQGRSNANVKQDIPTQSGENSETPSKPSSQALKTPGINWLKGDAGLLTNPFTPGKNIFLFSKNDQETQANNTDSGIDTYPSSQSNFFSTLKNDAAQSFNFKHNHTFNKTPFRGEGNNDNNLLKEQNHVKPSFPKLDFSEIKEDNKENIDKKHNRFQIQENLFDPSWNQLKRICDAAIVCPSVNNSEYNNFHSVNRSNFERITNEPLRSSIFAPISDRNDRNDLKKDDDDSGNVPLDLSSGDSQTQRTVFARSLTGNDKSLVTVVSHVAEEDDDKNVKQRASSDAISSILPTFLAQTNKMKCTTSESNVISNDKYSTVASETKLYSAYGEKPNTFTTKATTNNSQFSSIKIADRSEKQETPKNEACKDYQHIHQRTPYGEDNILKDILKSSFPTKLVSPPNEAQQCTTIKSPSDNKPDQPVPCFSDLYLSSKDKQSYDNCLIDVPSNNINSNESASVESVEKSVPVNQNQYLFGKVEQSLEVSISQGQSSHKEVSKSKEISSEGSHLNNQPAIPLSNEMIVNIQKQSSVVASSLNSSISNPVQTHLNKPESNSCIPLHSKQQIHRNSPQKIEGDSQHVQTQALQVQVPQEKKNECSDIRRKPTPVEHHVQCEKRPIQNCDPIFNQHHKNQHLSTISHQPKTYLAPPQHHSHNKMLRNDFPHKKPEIPQQMSNRPSFAMMEKPHDGYTKMPPPQGRLSRTNNGELFVNGKAYTILSILGRGGSSEVYQVLDRKSSKLLAVKCVDLSLVDQTIAEGYLNEIDLLSKLQGCSSVIRMFDYEYTHEYKMLYVVMEKGDTDLSHLIRDISKTKKISMSMIIYYWTEILTAVRDIHEQGIIHSDLKPANFLLVSGRLKLIDFGIASSQGDMTSVMKEVTTGTWNYMSPEALRNNSASGKGFKITYKSDVWSLGCILYNLIYGKTPFSHITNVWTKLQAIADPNHRIDFPEVGAPVVLLQALRSCFHRDPKQRPTVAELLNLPYHATYDPSHIGRQVHTILPQEWWLKVAHLFPGIKCEDKIGNTEDKESGGNAV